MGLKYTRRTGGVLGGGPYRAMASKLQDIYAEELEDAGALGLLEAQDTVENSGTAREWSGPFRDRDGTIRYGTGSSRVASGNMLNALDYRIVRGKNVGLDVGWIRIWEEYFGAQDKGFSAPGYRRERQAVAGMGVIAHLKTFMRDEVDKALDRAGRRIVDGL